MLDRRNLVGAIAAATALSASGARAAAPKPPRGPWQQEGVVARGGGVIHWVSMGKGPVLVLLPKVGGWVADWRHVAPLLADRYRVIVIDPPGHGGSRMATPAPQIHTVAESAAMIRAALHEMGVTRYAIGGNSLGGEISIVMAALWPEDVTHLVLLSTALLPAETRERALAPNPATDGDFEADGTPKPRSYERMNARFAITRQTHDEQNASRAAAGPWARASERGVAVAGITSYLPRIQAPTLLVYGTTGAYPKYREVGLKLIPHPHAETVAGAGSFLHQEQPREAAAVIGKFLQEKS